MIELLHGDSREILANHEGIFDYCLTSPPYFQQLDYEVDQQIGLETELDEYLDQLGTVFDHVLRLLREGGVCYIVIGDTFNNYSPIRARSQRRGGNNEWLFRRKLQPNLLEKECLDVPHRLKDFLRTRGWHCRMALIWDKGTSSVLANSDTAPLCHEVVLQMFRWSGQSRPYLNCHPLRRSVLTYRSASDPVHPCPFPLNMAVELASSIKPHGDDPIRGLDPFCGSGVAARAAQQLGHDFLGIELSERYLGRARELLGQPSGLFS